MSTKQIIAEIVIFISFIGLLKYVEYLKNNLYRVTGFWIITNIEDEEDPGRKIIGMCNQCSFADYCKFENGKYIIYKYCPSCGSVMVGTRRKKEYLEIDEIELE